MLLLVAIVFLVSRGSDGIMIQLGKGNLVVQQGSSYLSNVLINKQNSYLIPTTIRLSTNIANSIPTFGNYFDFFFYLTQVDIACYEQAVNNQSFMFPCPFVANKYSKIRINNIQDNQNTQIFSDINSLSFAYILDNTLFPFPEGAYCYSPISISIMTNIQISISNIYEQIGIKLMFINVTVLVIFMVIMVVIFCKIKKLQAKMQQSWKQMQERGDLIEEADLNDSNKSQEEIKQLEIQESVKTA